MAATTTSLVKVTKMQGMGNLRYIEAQVNGPGNYDSTNNHIVTAKQLNLSRIHGFTISGAITISTGAPSNLLSAFPGDPGAANSGEQGFGSIQIIWATTPLGVTEVSNDTDLTGKQFRLLAWGDAGGAF